jgi:hypothetical protein
MKDSKIHATEELGIDQPSLLVTRGPGEGASQKSAFALDPLGCPGRTTVGEARERLEVADEQ